MKVKTSSGTVITMDGNMVCEMKGDCVMTLIRVDRIMDEKSLREFGEALDNFRIVYCREYKE